MLKQNQYLPVCLSIKNKKVLIVGGGKIAYRKIKMLLPFTNKITVLSLTTIKEIKRKKLKIINSGYDKKYLKGYFLVYACTNNQKINKRIKTDAGRRNILVNVVDNPELCDFISPAIYIKDEMVVAVNSNARNVKKSIRWRDKIKERIR